MEQNLQGWAEDPVWNAYVKCTVRMLELLKPATEYSECTVRLLPGGRAVEKFRILGHVVSLKVQERKTEFTLDDGTGMLLCTWWSEADWFRSKPFISRESLPSDSGTASCIRKMIGSASYEGAQSFEQQPSDREKILRQ
jgi:hypothetical protein